MSKSKAKTAKKKATGKKAGKRAVGKKAAKKKAARARKVRRKAGAPPAAAPEATAAAAATPAERAPAKAAPKAVKKKKPVRKKSTGARARKKTSRARGLTARDRDHFRALLLERHRELTQAYAISKDDSRSKLDDGTEDYIDYAVSSYAREFLLSLNELDRKQLMLVEDALKRLDRGSFGRCQQCGKPIVRKRLEAAPWAENCLRCQELEEQGLLSERSFSDGDSIDSDYDEIEDYEDEEELEEDEEEDEDQEGEGEGDGEDAPEDEG